MSRDIVQRKLSVLFDTFDIDGQGFVQKTDFDRPAAWMAGRLGHHTGSAVHLKVRAAYHAMWEHLAPMDADGDGRVTRAEFIEGWKQMAGGDQFATTIGQSSSVFFDAVDTDADGRISAEEFANWLCGHVVDRANALASFARLDRKKAGTLTKADIGLCAKEYFTSQDPAAPGNWLHGPWE